VSVIDHKEAQRLGIKGSSEDDPSGHALAEAAYAAGAVKPAASPSTFDVALSVAVTGSRFDAEYVAAILEQHCDRLAKVDAYTFTVSERET
jgi:hypothetical protein